MKILVCLLLFGLLIAWPGLTWAQASKPISVQVTAYPTASALEIKANSPGVVSVAILSSATFDPKTVDPKTVSLTAPKVKLAGPSQDSSCHESDVNKDGLADLVCAFPVMPSAVEPGHVTAVLEGRTFDRLRIRSEFPLRIVAGQ